MQNVTAAEIAGDQRNKNSSGHRYRRRVTKGIKIRLVRGDKSDTFAEIRETAGRVTRQTNVLRSMESKRARRAFFHHNEGVFRSLRKSFTVRQASMARKESWKDGFKS